MTGWRSLRQADAVESCARQPIDLAGFAGIWYSSDRRTRGIYRLELEVRGGVLRGRVYGASSEGEVGWGEATAAAVYSDGVTSATGAGFILHYDVGFAEYHLQANLKLGVLVLGSFATFRDASDRRRYFAREFSSQVAPPPQSPGPASPDRYLQRLQDLDFGTYAERGPVDPSLLLGLWRNTNTGSQGIVQILVESRGTGLALRLWGAHAKEPIDWGEVSAEVFACVEEDEVASAAALASYDFGFMESELQVRQNKGILAVTLFNRFHDGSERNNYVVRELFHRHPVEGLDG